MNTETDRWGPRRFAHHVEKRPPSPVAYSGGHATHDLACFEDSHASACVLGGGTLDHIEDSWSTLVGYESGALAVCI